MRRCGERSTARGKAASARRMRRCARSARSGIPNRRRRPNAVAGRRQQSGDPQVPAAVTPSRPKALISWSSGKDSAYALHAVRRAGEFDVVGALTTVTETFGRVSIHGVRQEILLAQCEAAGLPPRIVPIPYPCPNEVYEARLGAAVASAAQDGITHIIFGDLFLRDIRTYREQKLAGTGITPVFPLWERPTLPLAQAMIADGFEAYLATVDLNKLPAEFAGRKFDRQLLADLARRRRSLRRERRIPYLCGGRPDLYPPPRNRHRRARRARRLCVLRSGDAGLSAETSAHPSIRITAARRPAAAGQDDGCRDQHIADAAKQPLAGRRPKASVPNQTPTA